MSSLHFRLLLGAPVGFAGHFQEGVDWQNAGQCIFRLTPLIAICIIILCRVLLIGK